MVSWEFFSKRRRTSLSKFLSGVLSYEDALSLFEQKKVFPPKDGSLENMYATSADKFGVVAESVADGASEAEPDPTPGVDESPEEVTKDWGIKPPSGSKKTSSSRK